MYEPLPYETAANLANKRHRERQETAAARLASESAVNGRRLDIGANPAAQAHARIDALIEWVQNIAHYLSDHPNTPLSVTDLMFADPFPQDATYGNPARTTSVGTRRTAYLSAWKASQGHNQ